MPEIEVMIFTLFWSWLWGIPGLATATPFTAALGDREAKSTDLEWLRGL